MTPTFVVAHFHFIMVGGTLTAYLAAHALLVPQDVRPNVPNAGAWSLDHGVHRLLFHVHAAVLAGNAGMPRRYYSYPAQFQWLHVLSTAGASILTGGLV